MEKSKKKLVVKGTSLVLAGVMATAFLSGCGKKKTLFQDTMLENAVVMYVDDNALIVRPERYNDGDVLCMGAHYVDVVTGAVYHNNKHDYKEGLSDYKSSDKCLTSAIAEGVIIVDDAKIVSLTQYLTEEELKKANEGDFTDSDVIAVQQRLTKTSK